MARAMSSSVTVTTSSTRLLMWAKQRSPGRPTAMPSAIVANDSSRTGAPACSEGGTAAAPGRLHADHPDVRVGALATAAMPGDQPAAADAGDDRAHVRALLQDLQPDRALTGDHVRVVERVDEDRTGTVGELVRRDQALVDRVPGELDLRAVRLGRGDLRQRRAHRHEHGGLVRRACPAASATPWAWLPALAATTPRARSAAVSREMRR